MLHDNKLMEMFLRLKRSEPIFRTLRELPAIGRKHRTRDDIRLERNLPISFMLVRQTPTETFIFSFFTSSKFRFSFTDITSLKKCLQRSLKAVNL